MSLKTSQLLVSRLCHELVGAAGALKNGVELVSDEKDVGIDEEVLSLLSMSAEQLSARLVFYRVAYGYAGNKADNFSEIRNLILRFIEQEQDIQLSWLMAPVFPDIRDGIGRLFLLITIICKMSLPRGGEIEVDVSEEKVVFAVRGEGAALPDGFQKFLDMDDIENDDIIDNSNIHLWLTASILRDIGDILRIEQSIDKVVYCLNLSE